MASRDQLVRVCFEFRDELSRGEWRAQQCVVRSLEECIKIYGLGTDCEYRITKVEPVS